jgi:kinetochore protein NDC80
LGPAPPRSSLAPARFVRSSSGGNLVSDIGVMQMTASLGSSGSSSQRESLRNSRQSYAPQQSVKYTPLIPCFSFCAAASVVASDLDRVNCSGRRSSAYTNGRPSSIGFLSQVPPSIAKDPRPIRDKTYMANAQRNIIDYLISANYPTPISIKTLQVPTSKDFAQIFKFLYNRMDPNYQFVKKIEDEVVTCLKALKYLRDCSVLT